MKLALPALALSLAALTAAQYDDQSKAFHLLVVTEDDDSLNGTTLSACHSGAAIESLCLSTGNSDTPLDPAPFYFNSSDSTQPNVAGILVFDLPTADLVVPSALQFNIDATINYALPLFFPDDSGQSLVVDEHDLFYVQGYVDYSVDPPKAGTTTNYYRWYVCTTYYGGYEYKNVVWGLGEAEPESPGCIKVDLKRVFI